MPTHRHTHGGGFVDDQSRVDPTAFVSGTNGANVVGAGSYVGPGCIINNNVNIGTRTMIGANCVIGQAATIGNSCTIFPGVIVAAGAVIPDNTVLYPSTSSLNIGIVADRARQLLGPGLTSITGSELDADDWYQTTAGASPVATVRGGVVLAATSAAAAQTSQIRPYFGSTNCHIGNPRTDLWYWRCRWQLKTAIDAQTLGLGPCLGSTAAGVAANAEKIVIGVNGSVSTVNYTMAVYSGADAVSSSISLGVPIDINAWHISEMWSNGTNAFIALDGTQVASVLSNTLPNVPVNLRVLARNGTTAAIRSAWCDYLYAAVALAP